jgi:glutathione S-transferase
MILYTFHRSSASYRVRIALNYKKLAYTPISINLVTGEQRKAEFKSKNPQGRMVSTP